MGPVLAQAEQPVDLVAGRVIASDGHASLGGEIQLPVGEPQPVRAAEGTQIDPVQLLPGRDVDHRDGIAASRAGAGVIAGERELSVVRNGQLMRILPGRDAAHHLAARRIDDCHRVLALVKDKQRG